MYFFRVKKLIKKLAKDELTQKDIMKSSIFVFVFQYFYIFCYMDFTSTLKIIFINFVCYTLITIFGIYLTYRKNKQGDNKNFLERFICLSVPLGIRVIVLFIIIHVAVNTLSEVSNKEIYSYCFDGKTFRYSLVVMMHVLFYLKIISSFGEISSKVSKRLNVEILD